MKIAKFIWWILILFVLWAIFTATKPYWGRPLLTALLGPPSPKRYTMTGKPGISYSGLSEEMVGSKRYGCSYIMMFTNSNIMLQ
jgi:hypothetical protein